MIPPEKLEAKLVENFPKVERAQVPVKEYPTFQLDSARTLVPAARWLKDEMGFEYLDMVTGTDWLGPVDVKGYVRDPNPNPFVKDGGEPKLMAIRKTPKVGYRDAIELVYCFASFQHKLKVFLKVDVPRDGGEAPTLSGVYRTAQWQEREVFDLLGVGFTGHPDLRKILTPDFIEGHPLRKDYVHKKDRFD